MPATIGITGAWLSGRTINPTLPTLDAETFA